MTIKTDRLFLREMTENDVDALYCILADADNMRYYPYAFDRGLVQNWISPNQKRYRIFGFGLWAVCLKGSGEVIGDCGLTMQNINGTILPRNRLSHPRESPKERIRQRSCNSSLQLGFRKHTFPRDIFLYELREQSIHSDGNIVRMPLGRRIHKRQKLCHKSIYDKKALK